MEETLIDLIAHGEGNHRAVVVASDGSSLTYQQLQQQTDRLAITLAEYGIDRGDRVAIALPNGIEMIAAFLAASAAGTAAPLNPGYRTEEFRFYLEDTNARALIVPPNGAEEARAAASESTLILEVSWERGEIRCHGAGARRTTDGRPAPKPDETALVLHTSGTTSRPKRVPLTHANLLTSARNVAATYGLTPSDVSLCVMPLFHVHGLVASTLGTLFTGGTVVVMPRFNPLSFWPAVKEHRATWYSAVPTIHQLLLARSKPGARPAGAESLRFIRSCSASLPPQTMAEMEERFGVAVLEAYGMTEAAHQMASNPLPPGARKPGSVGCGTGVQIAILNEAGDELSAGLRGEVAIQGANVTRGYESNPQANAEAFTNRWFRTGDEGFLDGDGYLTLVGRIKELINRGGEKISPREIDEVLLTHPAVSEAVCFGVPDRVYGEEVAAAVVLKGEADAAELISHCKASLSAFKCPKAIHILDSIPRTATGKIQRRNVAAEIENRNSSQVRPS